MKYSLLALFTASMLALPAAAYDHSAFDGILKQVVNGTKVDYGAVKKNKAALEAYIAGIESADTKGMKGTERAAFIVNAYNAHVMNLVVKKGLPGSGKGVLDVPGFFDKQKVKVGGKMYTLNKLEARVRPPNGTAAVHFIVNCASISCPPLAPFAYTADNYGRSISKQTRKYLKRKGAVEIDDAAKTITVVKLFEWYEKDFGGKDGVRKFLAKYGFEKAKDPAYTIKTREYNWKLNSK